ncbi:hypothetical protein ACWDAO_31715, partial [Streptomyces sp. NPDC001212]
LLGAPNAALLPQVVDTQVDLCRRLGRAVGDRVRSRGGLRRERPQASGAGAVERVVGDSP